MEQRTRALEVAFVQATRNAGMVELQRHEASGLPLTDETIGRVTQQLEDAFGCIAEELEVAKEQTADVSALLRHYRAQGTAAAPFHPYPNGKTP